MDKNTILNKKKKFLNIFLLKELIVGKKLSDSGLLVYIGLREVYSSDHEIDYVNFRRLEYFLFGDKKEYPKRIDKIFLAGLKELSSIGLIKMKRKYAYGEYLIDMSKLYFEKKHFVIIRNNEITSILNSGRIDSSIKMLRYFIYVIGSFSHSEAFNQYKDKVGSYTIEEMTNALSLSRSSVIKYNTILEDLGLLYVTRSNKYIKKESNTIKSLKNCYSRYEDRGLCESFSEDQERIYSKVETVYQAEKRMEEVCRHKSLAKKYQAISRGAKSIINYKQEDVKEIYEYVLQHNKVIEHELSLPDNRGEYTQNYWKEKLWDTECFNIFPYMEKEIWGDNNKMKEQI